jgi:COMPASS component BRE2
VWPLLLSHCCYELTRHSHPSVYNKKNFHYMHCIADPTFPSSFYYRQTEPEPHGPHMSFEDAATHMFLDQSGRHITTDKGFRMARANVAVRQGRWYWECRVTRGTVRAPPAGEGEAAGGKTESHGHVRVGFARREASLDAPVGFDAYSYGIRDVEGQKMHMSRPKDFFPPGEEIAEGDVIGLEIQLPSEHLHRKVVLGQYNPAVDALDDGEGTSGAIEGPNIVRDRIPIRFKAHIYFEKIDYHTTKELEDLMNPSPVGSGSSNSSEAPNPNHPVPALRTLPNSYIKIYKNGVLMGTPFTNLLAFLPPASKPQAQVGAREGMDDGMLGYYPAISVFRGGAAEVNFGPDFWYPPSGYKSSDGTAASTENATAGGEAAAATEDVEMGGTAPVVDQDTVMVAAVASGPAPSGKLLPVSERYMEQIVEDIVADIVDEADFWMQDGARVIDRTGGRDQKADVAVSVAPGREEIKELVQDD